MGLQRRRECPTPVKILRTLCRSRTQKLASDTYGTVHGATMLLGDVQ